MRILDWSEVADLEIGTFAKPLPHEYGKYLWVWVWHDQRPLMYGRTSYQVRSDEWRSVVGSVAFGGGIGIPHSNRTSNTDARVLRAATSLLLTSATTPELALRELGGFLYFKVAKPLRLHYETDTWIGRSSLAREDEYRRKEEIRLTPKKPEFEDFERGRAPPSRRSRASLCKERVLPQFRVSKPAPEEAVAPLNIVPAESRGLIVDIEYVLNAREVPTLSDERYWVLETPLEHPPGFVWETARLLERELGSKHHFSTSFKELVYAGDTVARERWLEEVSVREDQARAAGLPSLVPPQLVGPDETWRYSANPQWVRTILMARLIGGPFWTYVFGALEALHGQVMDWTTLK